MRFGSAETHMRKKMIFRHGVQLQDGSWSMQELGIFRGVSPVQPKAPFGGLALVNPPPMSTPPSPPPSGNKRQTHKVGTKNTHAWQKQFSRVMSSPLQCSSLPGTATRTPAVFVVRMIVVIGHDGEMTWAGNVRNVRSKAFRNMNWSVLVRQTYYHTGPVYGTCK